jgi:hypothetical protein
MSATRGQSTVSARLRLGLPAGPAIAPAPRCASGSSVLPDCPDHPLMCTCLAQQGTPRHDFVRTNLRQIVAWAGIHTTDEPALRYLDNPHPPQLAVPAPGSSAMGPNSSSPSPSLTPLPWPSWPSPNPSRIGGGSCPLQLGGAAPAGPPRLTDSICY